MRTYPNQMELISARSDPLMADCAHAGFTIINAMEIGVSPIAVKCNERWKPLLSLLGEKFGYCWEWVSTDGFPSTESYSANGEVVLTKVVA